MAIAEALVGAVIGELLRAVLEVKGKIEHYNAVFEGIAPRLEEIEPIVREIDDLDRKLDRAGGPAKQLLAKIKGGKQLIQDCSSEMSGCCSCFKKPQYLGRLQELESSLDSFCKTVVPLQNLKETMEMRDLVEQNLAVANRTYESVDVPHQELQKMSHQMKGLAEDVQKLLALQQQLGGTPFDANTISQMQGKSPIRTSGDSSGEESLLHPRSAPSGVPGKTTASVPIQPVKANEFTDRGKYMPTEYGHANSMGNNGGRVSNNTISLAPGAPSMQSKGKDSSNEYNGSHPMETPRTASKGTSSSGFSRTLESPQVKENPLDQKHPDQMKMTAAMTHNVVPWQPSPPPKSPEVVQEIITKGREQFYPVHHTDSPLDFTTFWQKPSASSEPRKVKEFPDKVKDMPKEPAYAYFSDDDRKVGGRLPDSTNKTASWGKDSPSQRHSSNSVKAAASTSGDAPSSHPFGLPPKSPELKGSSQDGGQTKKVAPTTNNTTYPHPYMHPESPKMTIDASSSYRFWLPPKPPEVKGINPDFGHLNQTKKVSPTTNNPTSSNPYAPTGSPNFVKDVNLTSQGNLIPPQKTDSSFDFTPHSQRLSTPTPPKPPEMKTVLPKDHFGYSNPTETRSTPTSSDMASSRSSVPWTTSKAKEIDHEEEGHISNSRKSGHSIPSRNIGNMASNYAPPGHPVPDKAPAVKMIPQDKRRNRKGLKTYDCEDYGEDGFSY